MRMRPKQEGPPHSPGLADQVAAECVCPCDSGHSDSCLAPSDPRHSSLETGRSQRSGDLGHSPDFAIRQFESESLLVRRQACERISLGRSNQPVRTDPASWRGTLGRGPRLALKPARTYAPRHTSRGSSPIGAQDRFQSGSRILPHFVLVCNWVLTALPRLRFGFLRIW